MSKNNLLVWFSDIELDNHHAHGEYPRLYAKLAQAKFPIAPGFIITSDAYFSFLRETMLEHKIKQLLSTIGFERPDSVMQAEQLIKQLFAQAKLSDELTNQLLNFYDKLDSSAVTIALHEKESRGRKHASLHANDRAHLLKEVKNAWAEMFTGNALWHRHQQKLDHLRTNPEIIVQKKIRAATKGTVMTINPHTHAKDQLIIITQQPHIGDRYVLSKKTFSILDRHLEQKTDLAKLSHDEILAIAKMAKRLEEYLYFPQEISWAIDEDTLYLIETKPFSTLPQAKIEKKTRLPIARGKGITQTIGTGVVHIIQSPTDLRNIKAHDVVIISDIEKKHLPKLKKARAVIVQSHIIPHEFAILIKQQGIPAIGNVKNAKKNIKNGLVITVHGEKGEIYSGGYN